MDKFRIHRVCFIGDSMVGKSAIIRRISDNDFKTPYEETLTYDFVIKNIIYQESAYKI